MILVDVSDFQLHSQRVVQVFMFVSLLNLNGYSRRKDLSQRAVKVGKEDVDKVGEMEREEGEGYALT